MVDKETLFQSPLQNAHERIRTLLSCIDRVDNPAVAISFLQIMELLSDIGVMLQTYNNERLELNPDIFEDPLNRGDALGNVRMIHKPQTLFDQNLLESLGDALLTLCHEYFLRWREGQRVATSIQDDDYGLGEWDMVRCEEIHVAKKLIKKLRLYETKLDQRNANLFCQNQTLKRKLTRQRWLTILATHISLYERSQRRSSQQFLDVGESSMQIFDHENRQTQMRENSQLNCLAWDEDGKI